MSETDYEAFIAKCIDQIPPGYDCDDSQECIILRYLEDVQALSGIVARLTSDYR